MPHGMRRGSGDREGEWNGPQEHRWGCRLSGGEYGRIRELERREDHAKAHCGEPNRRRHVWRGSLVVVRGQDRLSGTSREP